MYLEAHTPSEICAVVASAATSKKHAEIASSAARADTQPNDSSPCAGNTLTDDGHQEVATQSVRAVVGSPIPDAAILPSQSRQDAPYLGTSTAHHDKLLTLQDYYRLRVDMIRARTKLILQAQASLRRMFDGDKEMAAKTYAEAAKDDDHQYRPMLAPYLSSLGVLDDQQKQYEKEMVRTLKSLPILEWARGVKGLGDLSLACIIGETTGFAVQDIVDQNGIVVKAAGEFYSMGDFKSVSALWKRLGVAVIDGRRQGAPGKGASADDWIAEAYSKSRRSVLWNVGNSIILSMGKFRPLYGEDVDANPNYTELQKVFARRARYEAERLPHKDGVPIKESKTGKDSYSLHAANRAKRYTEKRMLRMLYSEWRRCMA